MTTGLGGTGAFRTTAVASASDPSATAAAGDSAAATTTAADVTTTAAAAIAAAAAAITTPTSTGTGTVSGDPAVGSASARRVAFGKGQNHEETQEETQDGRLRTDPYYIGWHPSGVLGRSESRRLSDLNEKVGLNTDHNGRIMDVNSGGIDLGPGGDMGRSGGGGGGGVRDGNEQQGSSFEER